MTGSNYSLSSVRERAGSRGRYDECLTHHTTSPDLTKLVLYATLLLELTLICIILNLRAGQQQPLTIKLAVAGERKKPGPV